MGADCALRGVRDEGLDRGDGRHVAPRLLHQPIHHVLRSTRSRLSEELQHCWSGRYSLADTASEAVARLQQCTLVYITACHLPYVSSLRASQVTGRSSKRHRVPSGTVLGYRAVMTSMPDTTEVMEGAIP